MKTRAIEINKYAILNSKEWERTAPYFNSSIISKKLRNELYFSKKSLIFLYNFHLCDMPVRKHAKKPRAVPQKTEYGEPQAHKIEACDPPFFLFRA